MGVFCVNIKSKDFKDTAKRLDIHPNSLEVYVHLYQNLAASTNYMEATDELPFPSDEEIQEYFFLGNKNSGTQAIDAWVEKYGATDGFILNSELEEANRLFGSGNVHTYKNYAGNIVHRVSRPNITTKKELKYFLEKLHIIDSNGDLLGISREKFYERMRELAIPAELYMPFDKELKQQVALVFKRNPELAAIGTEEQYIQYLATIFPNSLDKSIYWHGTNSDFSEGFTFAKREEGSGALETKNRNDFYLARLAWSVLQYVNGVNRKSVDKNGFAHWNKLWWELKEIMSNGRRGNNDWKDLVIGSENVRQAIPNKKGVFNRDTGGENGKWLKERKADYGYENKSDKEFFEEILGVKWGEDTFNTWTQRNAEIFKSLEETEKGIYPAVINTLNPIRETGQNTYYEEQRGLMSKADREGYDAIIGTNTDNEFGSDIAVVLRNNDNVHFLGTTADKTAFSKFVAKEFPSTIHSILNPNNYTQEMLDIKEQAIADGTFMKAPNGRPTNLTEKQWLQVRTKAFKDWFGDWENPTIFTANNVDDIKSLQQKYPSELPNKFYHHSTNRFGKQAFDSREGNKEKLHIVGRLTTDKVDVLVVENPNSENKISHITLATAEGVKPFESNRELENNQDKIQPLDDYVNTTFTNNLRNDVSKVVDENGEPLVVYHGSKTANIRVFKKDDYNSGYYYTSDINYAKAKFGNEIYQVFLNIKNPVDLRLTYSKDGYGAAYYKGRKLNHYEQSEMELNHKNVDSNAPYYIKEGYDGIFGNDSVDTAINGEEQLASEGTEYVVWNPNQIKSATDNSGEFAEDNDNIYYQKSILTELSKLRQLNQPLAKAGSLKKMKERLKNANLDSIIVNTIMKAVETDGSLAGLTPLLIFNLVTRQQEKGLAQLYNEYIQKPIDKALEEHLLKFLEPFHVTSIEEDLMTTHGVTGIYDIINKIIHLAKAENRNAITVTEEVAHAIVELLGAKKSRKEENKDYTFLFDNIESTDIYKQVYDEYKDTYLKKDKQGNLVKDTDGNPVPDIVKIKKEALGQALAVAINNKWENEHAESENSFWTKLKEWIEQIFKFFADKDYVNIDTLLNQIATEVIHNNYSRFKKVDDSNYRLLDYAESIANQNKQDGGKALEFMQFFSNEMGNIITGSIAYRKQGPVYRGKLDALHDIDMVVPLSVHGIPLQSTIIQLGIKSALLTPELRNFLLNTEYFKKIIAKYPKMKLASAFSDNAGGIVCNAIYSEDERLSEKFMLLSGDYAHRLDAFTEEERKQIYLFDFFIENLDEDSVYDKLYNLNISDWKRIFKAKLKMGRAKDIFDYQMWDVFEEFKSETMSEDEYLMFQKPIVYNPEQQEAIRQAGEYLADENAKEDFFLITGKAGTGKSTIINEIIKKETERTGVVPSVYITAVANKAVKVLSKKIEAPHQARAIASSFKLQGFRDKNGNLGFRFPKKGWDPASTAISLADIIIIDEASMIGGQVIKAIQRFKQYYPNKKFIVLGDINQLPAIKDPENQDLETESLSVFSYENKREVKLLTRVRQGEASPILSFSDKFAETDIDINHYIEEGKKAEEQSKQGKKSSRAAKVASIPDISKDSSVITKDGAVIFYKDSTSSIDEEIVDSLVPIFKEAQLTKNPNLVKIVAIHVSQVSAYNHAIYKKLHPEETEESLPLHEGDLIMFYNQYDKVPIPGTNMSEPLYFNSDLGAIKKVLSSPEIYDYGITLEEFDKLTKGHKANLPQILVLDVEVERDGKSHKIKMVCPKEGNLSKLQNFIRNIWSIIPNIADHDAKTQLMEFANNLDSSIAQIDLGYAVSIHKSLGSTYDVVVVDAKDVMGLKKQDGFPVVEKIKGLYTGITRASNITVMLRGTQTLDGSKSPETVILDVKAINTLINKNKSGEEVSDADFEKIIKTVSKEEVEKSIVKKTTTLSSQDLNEEDNRTPMEIEDSKWEVIFQEHEDTIEFIEDSHEYYYYPQGKDHPESRIKMDTSVTSITNPVNKKDYRDPKDGLDWLGVSANIGSTADKIVRDYFRDIDITARKYPNFTHDLLVLLSKDLKNFKLFLDKQFEGSRYKVITNPFALIGKITKDNGTTQTVGGTLDILIYDENGFYYIYDIKTSRNDLHGKEKLNNYTSQVNMYREMLEVMHPELRGCCGGLGILQLNTFYATPKNLRFNGSTGATIYTVDNTGQLQANGKAIEITKEYKAPCFPENNVLKAVIKIIETVPELYYEDKRHKPITVSAIDGYKSQSMKPSFNSTNIANTREKNLEKATKLSSGKAATGLMSTEEIQQIVDGNLSTITKENGTKKSIIDYYKKFKEGDILELHDKDKTQSILVKITKPMLKRKESYQIEIEYINNSYAGDIRDTTIQSSTRTVSDNLNEATKNRKTGKTLSANMWEEYGTEKRKDVSSITTLDAIVNGERTATTRWKHIEGFYDQMKKGDIVEFHDNNGRSILVRITKAPHKLSSDLDAEEWSKKEGWSEEYFENNVRDYVENEEAYQLEYEYIEGSYVNPESPARSRISDITISYKKDRDNYIKGNPLKHKDTAFIFTENALAHNKLEGKKPIGPDVFVLTNVNAGAKGRFNQADIRTNAKGEKTENAFGLIVKKYLLKTAKDWVAQEGCFENTDEDFELFKKMNLEMFDALEKSDYNKLVFPFEVGLGKAALPKRFVEWLLKQLEFRYGIISSIEKNQTPGYKGYGLRVSEVKEASTISGQHTEIKGESISSNQNVTSNEVIFDEDGNPIDTDNEFDSHFTVSKGQYGQRTAENAEWSDITLAIATDFTTPGERATKREAGNKYHSFSLPIKGSLEDSHNFVTNGQVDALRWAKTLKIKEKFPNGIKLNIAGNGIYTLEDNGYTQLEANDYLYGFLAGLQQEGINVEVKSGGQTGIDEAGIIAAQRLGIKWSVNAPNNWAFRVTKDIFNKEYKDRISKGEYKENRDGTFDIMKEQLFKERFIPDNTSVLNNELEEDKTESIISTLPEITTVSEPAPKGPLYTPYELLLIKEREALNALKDDANALFKPSELRDLAKACMFLISDFITLINSSKDHNEEWFTYLDDNNPRKQELLNMDFTQMDRIEVCHKLGFNMYDVIRSKYFNAVNNPNGANMKRSLRKKLMLINENFNAFLEMGLETLARLEEIQFDNLRVHIVNELGEAFNGLNIEEITEIAGSAVEHWQVSFRQVSAHASLSQLIKRTIGTLFKLDLKGEKILNAFGIPERVNESLAVNQILMWTQGSENLAQMISKLEEQEKSNPWLKLIISKLQESSEDETFKSQFWSNFKKYFQPYIILYQKPILNAAGEVINTVLTNKVINQRSLEKQMLDDFVSLQQSRVSEGTAMVLFNADGTINETIVKLLGEDLDTLKKYIDSYEENPEEAVAGTKTKAAIERIYRCLELDLDENSIEALAEDYNTIKDIYTHAKYLKTSKGLDLAIKNKTKDLDLTEKHRNDLEALFSHVVDNSDTVLESVAYEDGKLHYSYVTPSYLSNLMDKLKGNTEDYESFLEYNYGKYEWFKNGEHWRNEWLRLLDEHEEYRKELQHAVVLTTRPPGTTSISVGYRDKSPMLYEKSMLQNYFYGGNKSNWAFYRIPIMSNKPSEEYIRFWRYIKDTYKDDIAELLVNVALLEIDRIATVRARKADGATEKIKSFDKNGSKFLFLDYLLPILEEYQTWQKDHEGETIYYNEDEDGYIINKRLLLGQMLEQRIQGTENYDNESYFNEVLISVIKDSMAEKFEEYLEDIEKEGLLEQDAKGNYIHLKDLKMLEGKSVIDNLENFFWNDTFAAINILQLTITDIAYYKNAEDLQKRLAQIHAPGLRGNKDARWKVNGQMQTITDGKTRTIYLADFDEVVSDAIENIKQAFDKKTLELEKVNPKEAAQYREQAKHIIEAFEDINVTDAQGYNSPTSYRKKAIAFGKWSDELEELYLKIRSGEYTTRDLEAMMLPLKPFVYSNAEKQSVGRLSTLKVGMQNKNSEYLLLMMDAILLGETNAGNPTLSKLAAIYQVMEESHYDSEGNYKTDGIDTVQFNSTVKAGEMGVIDINFATTTQQAKEIIEESIYIDRYDKSLGYNLDRVHVLEFEDYCIQNEVPAHLEGESIFGSQMRILSISDMPEMIAGEEQFISFRGKKTSLREVKQNYMQAIADNIEQSMQEIIKKFNITGTRAERNIALSKLLQEQIKGDSRFGYDLLYSICTDEKGNFNIPLSDPINAGRVQQLLHSIIKTRINKQMIEGGPVVQVTNFGTSKELDIVFKDDKGNRLPTLREWFAQQDFSAFGAPSYEEFAVMHRYKKAKLGTREYTLYNEVYKPLREIVSKRFQEEVANKQAGIMYIECYAPSTVFKQFADEDGVIDLNKIPDSMKELIGFRIPTEFKYSMAPLKIVGLLPSEAGEGIMLPKDITVLSGSDFDESLR